ncbi:glutathione S-transferase C-terminal domain-containing protein [Marivibrio halodurans]|uniref:Glutathione S-transferase C-terminal domain-containing protein n=1 Tax=Marivibrio halodurans TaxID=2039722 RepID=A0A8J7V244_9PROT|nr:glutathione S-transferase C-terminal domain-containing protein [Marivibrio halodurans]MBP5858451.1 glutathione S-transferase C-terminal domain-containing protein [Marivibrio halodurans]
MIDFHYWPTPNGWKIAIMLEECALPYRMIPLDIGKGDQFHPDFLAISPNNRMPAILDHEGETDDGGPIPVFESGAILLHLARRTGRFMPNDPRGRKECEEWLFWQTGNLGPMAGQLSHFRNYAPHEDAYALDRYAGEYARCLAVLDKRLADRAFILGADYSIADMCCWPWAFIAKPLGQPLDDFPHVARWRKAIKERPAVRRAVDLGREYRRSAPPDDAERALLFRQNADSVRR